MRKVLLLCLLGIWSLLAHGASCHPVGGTISTNFLNPTTTFGSVTGDLGGGIGVSVLSLTENPNGTVNFHNQHHWVTSTGDTLNTNPAYATGFPTGITGLFAASYTDGIVVTGGTGKFLNATGKIYAWGAVNTANDEVVLRYQGTVCFADADSD